MRRPARGGTGSAAWAALSSATLLRTGSWNVLVYGPARAQMELENEMLEQIIQQQMKKPPNAR